jgi:pyrroloquinoline quinone biosynthesis protein B
MNTEKQPYLIVLGIAQDGGVPQAGSREHKGWKDSSFKRHVVCLGIVDPESKKRWMIEATPDFREQLHMLDEVAPVKDVPGIDGIFLTHAHMGHYTGLMYLGHESMGARDVPVYAMPRMQAFLISNGPWNQLVRKNNIALKPLKEDVPVQNNSTISIEPFLVPHREEYSEAIGYKIRGPNQTILFIPDIDSWENWDRKGRSIEEEISNVEVAYLDGTFFSESEVANRDMSVIPHPLITNSMERFKKLSSEDRKKIHFIHLNHTNPALIPDSDTRKTIEKNGFKIAEELERIPL